MRNRSGNETPNHVCFLIYREETACRSSCAAGGARPPGTGPFRKARPEWDEKASGPSSLLGDETGECLGDFLIPHLVKELPAVREDEVPIEGRKGMSVG